MPDEAIIEDVEINLDESQIKKNGINHYLGHFMDERSAAMPMIMRL